MIARIAMRTLAVLAGLLAAFLAVGVVLPKEVTVHRSIDIDATPEQIFEYLVHLDAWTEWTPWGAVESQLEGAESGPGATRTWDDPTLGSGSLTIVEATPPTGLTYEAQVEDGAIRFHGDFQISSNAERASPSTGSTVTWTETARWGLNPLLGWNGLSLEDRQGDQLQQSLKALREVVTAAGR